MLPDAYRISVSATISTMMATVDDGSDFGRRTWALAKGLNDT